MTLAALALLSVLVLAGGYLVERAVARELAAARLQADFVATVSARVPLSTHVDEAPARDAGGRRRAGEERRQRYYQVLSGETERLGSSSRTCSTSGAWRRGKIEYRFEALDAGAIVGQVAEDFGAQLASREPPRRESGWRETRVKGDREALGRALLNLLDNAAKYSPETAPIHLDSSSMGLRS